MIYSLFISCPRGLEYLLEEEVKGLGLVIQKVNPQGVYGEATLACIYKICMWSRLANRVQLILLQTEVDDEQQLYQACRDFKWNNVFSVTSSLAVEFHGESVFIRNTMFGAQRIKDGIVDHFRDKLNERPNIDRQQPQILIHGYLKKNQFTLSYDLNGYSLHQRGYRQEAGKAPIKENVAAALLLRAKWPQLALEGFTFQDPFCGSGTLIIEALMMAQNRAPGLLRAHRSFQFWTDHQEDLWQETIQEAQHSIKKIDSVFYGSDDDIYAIEIAKKNAQRANVDEWIHFQVLDVSAITPPTSNGLLACNPPYGERLGENTALVATYQNLGKALHQHYQNWQVAVITSDVMLAKAIGLRSTKQYHLYNGALDCKLYCFDLKSTNDYRDISQVSLSENATMLSNRLQKNYRHMSKWAKKNQITCYRVYDADLPEYAFAIDLYQDFAVLQEYAAPQSIPQFKADKRTLEVMQVVPKVLQINPDKIILKQRKRQKGKDQYQKLGQRGNNLIVQEGPAKLYVNLYDYLDTGLFLDHRPLRMQFSKLEPATRFLNCFCYTGSASVHAALAGAFTTNVDLSKTYLNWAEDNFKLNRIDLARHQFIHYDCREWLRQTRDHFDVIFLDPPSFSNSKRMQDTLDIQRDHVSLINSAMRLLNPGGVLYFSTNNRSFKMEESLFEKFHVQNISAQTIDQDFQRNSKIHYCFKIEMNYMAD